MIRLKLHKKQKDDYLLIDGDKVQLTSGTESHDMSTMTTESLAKYILQEKATEISQAEFDRETKPKIKSGDRFHINSDCGAIYMLAQVHANEYMILNPVTGNRFVDKIYRTTREIYLFELEHFYEINIYRIKNKE